jgi:hypothetical protein
MTVLMEEMGELQTGIENSDYFIMDAKIEETAAALGSQPSVLRPMSRR